eukprot:scaffold14555_cov29-Tisochrysis_lutea.AAC.5
MCRASWYPPPSPRQSGFNALKLRHTCWRPPPFASSRLATQKQIDLILWTNHNENQAVLAKALMSEDAQPKRTIKTNGGRSYPFTVGSGMPQGCPLSPLTFLLTTEAVTRAINGDEDIEGVDLNRYNLKISQFADDTSLIADSPGL